MPSKSPRRIFLGGVSYNFIRSGVGRYTLSILDFFAYEGRTADSFAPFAYLRQAGTAHDLSLHCDAVLVSDSTLEIHISINDLEQSGNSGGVAADAPFSIVVLRSQPQGPARPADRPQRGHHPWQQNRYTTTATASP